MAHSESCESVFARGSVVHQKSSNYALTNLLFCFCRSVWVIELFVNILSPHPGAPTRPFTPKVLRTRERAPTPFPFVVFTFGLTIESIKESRGASQPKYLSIVTFTWDNKVITNKNLVKNGLSPNSIFYFFF